LDSWPRIDERQENSGPVFAQRTASPARFRHQTQTKRACSVDGEWIFAVVTECQRFVCDASMEGTLDDGPRRARALATGLPAPPDAASASFLRATLLELAVRWGTEQHRRLQRKCRVTPCALATLADSTTFWPSQSFGERGGDLFVAHVTAIRNEL